MDRLQRIKEVEDEILKSMESWPHWKRAVAYRYLYNLGIRVDDIDRVINIGLKEEVERESRPIGPI